MKLNFYTVYLILVVQWFLCLVGIWFLGNIVADIKIGGIVYPSPYYFLFESVKFSISIVLALFWLYIWREMAKIYVSRSK